MLIQDLSATAHFDLLKAMEPRLLKEKIYRINGRLDIILTTETRGKKLVWHASLYDHEGKSRVPQQIAVPILKAPIFEEWMRHTKLFVCQTKDGHLNLSSYRIH